MIKCNIFYEIYGVDITTITMTYNFSCLCYVSLLPTS